MTFQHVLVRRNERPDTPFVHMMAQLFNSMQFALEKQVVGCLFSFGLLIPLLHKNVLRMLDFSLVSVINVFVYFKESKQSQTSLKCYEL